MAGSRTITQNPGTRPFLPPCRVCGDKAAGFHYGVNTCEACKGFFHRSLRKHKEYKCRGNRTSGHCEYKPGKRKSCQFCRYQKCLLAGMSKEAIKTGRYTYLKRTEDTREMKRLLSLKIETSPGFEDEITTATDAMYTTESFMESDSSELSLMDDHTSNVFAADSTYASESEGYSASEDDFSCSRVVSSICRSIHSANPSVSNRHTQTNYLNCNNRRSLKTEHTRSTTERSTISTRFHAKTEKSHPSLCSDSYMVFDNSENDFQTSENFDGEDSNITCQKTLHDLDDKNGFKNSLVYRLLRSAEVCKTEEEEDLSEIKTNIYESFENTRKRRLNLEPLTASSNLFKSSSLCTNSDCGIESSEGNFVNLKSSGLNNKDRREFAFDLFPDISFCLDGQPTLSPASVTSDDLESPTDQQSSDLLSSLTLSGPTEHFESPPASPGEVLLQQPEADDLCQMPEKVYTSQRKNIGQASEDNVTQQIMEEYTQGLDMIIDTPSCTEEQTPVQTLLTMPTSQELSLSPEPSTDTDIVYHNTAPSPIEIKHRDKTLHSHVVEELYSDKGTLHSPVVEGLYCDKDAVIAMLIAAHKENIGGYSHLSKEEMQAQQKAHYEAFMLKKQTFGELAFLQDQEYDEIYSITGIDVDNRRLYIQKYLSRMEKCVRGLVQFAKSIPGFSYLDINMQVNLIKLARSEFAIFTMYPTVNMDLGVVLGLAGEHWSCIYEWGNVELQMAISEYMVFCDKLQKMALTQEEEVLLKAIVVVSTDRDNSVHSPLADAIKWQLVTCLLHSLKKHRQRPLLFLARYIMTLAQSRTVAEKVKVFLRHLKMRKYSSIEQNPLLWEMYSWIILDEGEKSGRNLGQNEGEMARISPSCFVKCPVIL